MSMYAVLKTGGKQYRVEAGATLVVEKLVGEPGSAITFDRVLLVGDGEQVMVGTPTVPGALVSATVLGAELGQKIIVFKFKPKVKYRRRTGHRQRLTLIRIDAISADGKRVTAEPPGKADEPAKAAKPSKTDKAATAAKPARVRRDTKAVAAAKGEAAGTTTEPATVEATAPAKRRASRAATTVEVTSDAPPAAKPRARRAATADAAGATASASKPTRRRAAPKAEAAEGTDKSDGTEPAERAEKE
jgi:large subunit ribosomal protein L21